MALGNSAGIFEKRVARRFFPNVDRGTLTVHVSKGPYRGGKQRGALHPGPDRRVLLELVFVSFVHYPRDCGEILGGGFSPLWDVFLSFGRFILCAA